MVEEISNVQNFYRVVCNPNELWQFLEELPFFIVIEDAPSWPCLIEVWSFAGEQKYRYIEVCDLEGATRQYYIDEDPEYGNLMMVAQHMMFDLSMIQDSTKGE